MSFKNVRGPHNPVRTTMPLAAYRVMGFGTAPVDERDWLPRIDAVRRVIDVLDHGAFPGTSDELLAAFSVVKGLFSRIALGDTADWYTVSRLLGYPSSALSLVLSWRLAWARAAVRERDEGVFSVARRRILGDHCLEMLGNYLDMAVDAARPLDEHGWAYILWSSSERDLIHVGAASGSVEDVLGRLGREHPEHSAFGVLSAWLVHDPLKAWSGIRAALEPHLVGDGFYRLDLGDAKAAMESLLASTDNAPHSPWHGEQKIEPPARLASAAGEDLSIR